VQADTRITQGAKNGLAIIILVAEGAECIVEVAEQFLRDGFDGGFHQTIRRDMMCHKYSFYK
jgi:hypothetical protein